MAMRHTWRAERPIVLASAAALALTLIGAAWVARTPKPSAAPATTDVAPPTTTPPARIAAASAVR